MLDFSKFQLVIMNPAFRNSTTQLIKNRYTASKSLYMIPALRYLQQSKTQLNLFIQLDQKLIFKFWLCNFLVRTLKYFHNFLPMKTLTNCSQKQQKTQFKIFSTANRLKTSPNLIFCSIKMAQRGTYIKRLCITYQSIII